MSARRGPRRPPPARHDRVRLAAAILLASLSGRSTHVEDRIAAHERRSGDDGSADWSAPERRRLRELVYGPVRLRARYDHLITLHQRRPQKIDPRVRAVLWVALHEICELRAPEFASVDQAVETVRAMGLGWTDRFVNGLLRSVLRQGVKSAFPSPTEDPLAHARLWLSHPGWLVERWKDRLGAEEMLALCAAQNRRPSLILRAAKGQRNAALEEMAAHQWEAHGLDLYPDAIQVDAALPPALLLAQLKTPVVVQDAAAQLVAPLVLEGGARKVIDLCAAPGGKATHLALELGKEGRVLALDSSPARSRRMVANRRRLELESRMDVAVCDGRWPAVRPGWADAVLVDVPCTGTGVLSRRHEARWRREAGDLKSLPELQVELLHAAIDLVAENGVVVYSTCSLEVEENDEVVDRVLAERDDVIEIGVGETIDASMRQGEPGATRMQTWPHRHAADGAFAARLRRTRRVD